MVQGAGGTLSAPLNEAASMMTLPSSGGQFLLQQAVFRMHKILLLLNAAWFAAGFIAFSLRSSRFIRFLVRREDRQENSLLQLRTSLHFLGGFNFALSVFCIALAMTSSLFPDARQWQLMYAFLSLAHGMQFLCNLPVAIREKKKLPFAWPVLKGPMLFIFITDALLMIANATAALS